MLIQFRKLTTSDQPLQFHQTVDVSNAIKDRKDIVAVKPLDVDLKATPSVTGSVDVRGRLQGELEMNCSRRLKPISEHVHIPFMKYSSRWKILNLLFRMRMTILHTCRVRVWISPLCRRSILLHLPLAPVCKADCKDSARIAART